MASYGGQLPAYQYPGNAMINFEPLGNAVDTYREGIGVAGKSTAQINAANAMARGDFQAAQAELAKVDPRAALDVGLYPAQKEKVENEARLTTAKLLGGHAQTILDMTDPTAQRAAAEKWISSDPKFASGLQKMGVADWQADPLAAVKAIHGEAVGAQEPGKHEKTRAETYKLTQEGRLAGAQADLGSKTANAQDYNFYVKQEQAAGREPQSFNKWDLERKAASALAVTIDQKGELKFNQEVGLLQAKRFNDYVTQGQNSQQMIADINALREIGGRITTGKVAEITAALGPYADALGVDVKGLDDLQAYRAITSRLTPRMRVAGSGATSDYEMRTFLDALPNIGRVPGGNEIVANTLEALHRHNIAAAEIGSRAMAHEITPADAERQLRSLPDPMTLWREFRGKSPAAPASPTAPRPTPGTTDSEGWQVLPGGVRIKPIPGTR